MGIVNFSSIAISPEKYCKIVISHYFSANLSDAKRAKQIAMTAAQIQCTQWKLGSTIWGYNSVNGQVGR